MTAGPALAFLSASLLLACASGDGVLASPVPAGDRSYTFTIGPFEPTYAPPPAGTYDLPPIDVVTDHPLVDSSGHGTTLERVVGDRIAIVSFIYGTCSEKNGCPMSTAVLHGLDQRLAADPSIGRHVALVTVSFDPEHDTTERLVAMERMRATGSSWQFVTSPDQGSLDAMLADFGQTVSKLRTTDGRWTGAFRHVLKVYLVDRDRRVRNIYSVGLLHPDLVWNDIETLRIEDQKKALEGPPRNARPR